MSKLTSHYFLKKLLTCRDPDCRVKVINMYLNFMINRAQYTSSELIKAYMTQDWSKAATVLSQAVV